MDLAEMIRAAGIIGAGGAGFPTHVKAQSRAEIVLANGVECEPLLRVDRQMMENFPDKIVRGLKAMMDSTCAREGVLCVKKKNEKAIKALENAIKKEEHMRIYPLENYYPAGDEQQIVYEVTGRVVPTGGIPLDVDAVVNNVSTLMNIADAMDGIPVTERYLTVAGEVEHPATLKVPVGTPLKTAIDAACGPKEMEGYTLIVGGPATGKLCSDWSQPVLKTTGGVMVFKSDHYLIKGKSGNDAMDLKLAKAACSQCNMCTLMCPRNALGLGVEPHKVMRAAFMGNGNLLGDYNGVFSCCDCGICSYYACNFGLSPSRMMMRMKDALLSGGIKPEKKVKSRAILDFAKIPTARLIARMGIARYVVDAPLVDVELKVPKVIIPLDMNIGTPSVPVVEPGEKVDKGQLIAEIPEGRLGARVHASIDGTVRTVTDKHIEIVA